MAISKRRLEMGEEAWAEYQRNRKNKNSAKYASKAGNVEKVIRWRRNCKRKLIEYKGGKCEKCGLTSHINDLYDFHHIDPSQKDFGISKKGNIKNFEVCKREVDKCMLVCKNCHAIIHYELVQDRIYSRNPDGGLPASTVNRMA